MAVVAQWLAIIWFVAAKKSHGLHEETAATKNPMPLNWVLASVEMTFLNLNERAIALESNSEQEASFVAGTWTIFFLYAQRGSVLLI